MNNKSGLGKNRLSTISNGRDSQKNNSMVTNDKTGLKQNSDISIENRSSRGQDIYSEKLNKESDLVREKVNHISNTKPKNNYNRIWD